MNFLNLETTERFEEEMIDFGLLNIHNYTYGKKNDLTKSIDCIFRLMIKVMKCF